MVKLWQTVGMRISLYIGMDFYVIMDQRHGLAPYFSLRDWLIYNQHDIGLIQGGYRKGGVLLARNIGKSRRRPKLNLILEQFYEMNMRTLSSCPDATVLTEHLQISSDGGVGSIP